MADATQPPLSVKLCEAAEKGDIALARALLASGEHIEGIHCIGGCRYTPLISAAHCGHLEMVRFLLDRGADRHALANGKTAEEIAREQKHPEVANFLKTYDQNKNPDKIFFYDDLGDRTREDIYDFMMRERVTMIRQGKYGSVDTTTITGFSAIEDQSDESQLRKAFNEHMRRGGKADEALVFPHRLPKNKLTREG